jgi:hypothetical protein
VVCRAKKLALGQERVFEVPIIDLMLPDGIDADLISGEFILRVFLSGQNSEFLTSSSSSPLISSLPCLSHSLQILLFTEK